MPIRRAATPFVASGATDNTNIGTPAPASKRGRSNAILPPSEKERYASTHNSVSHSHLMGTSQGCDYTKGIMVDGYSWTKIREEKTEHEHLDGSGVAPPMRKKKGSSTWREQNILDSDSEEDVIDVQSYSSKGPSCERMGHREKVFRSMPLPSEQPSNTLMTQTTAKSRSASPVIDERSTKQGTKLTGDVSIDKSSGPWLAGVRHRRYQLCDVVDETHSRTKLGRYRVKMAKPSAEEGRRQDGLVGLGLRID